MSAPPATVDEPVHGATSGVVAVVAIDGPAGAGKSTAARMLARRLGFLLLDTGAIYRCVAVAAGDAGVDFANEVGLARVAESLDVRFEPGGDGDAQRVLLGARDVSELIRTPAVAAGASQVSAHAGVRTALLELQRAIAKRGRCVVEGRDIGSVVLPWAPVKFFLTASPAVRARRRHEELVARGMSSDLDGTLAEILARDQRDETRAAAPLVRAPDALLLDTSDLGLDAVVDEMERVARARLRLGS